MNSDYIDFSDEEIAAGMAVMDRYFSDINFQQEWRMTQIMRLVEVENIEEL